MILYFSAGSEIVEAHAKSPAVMLSYFSHTNGKRPNSRMKQILKIRRKAKKGVRRNDKG